MSCEVLQVGLVCKTRGETAREHVAFAAVAFDIKVKLKAHKTAEAVAMCVRACVRERGINKWQLAVGAQSAHTHTH